MDSDNNKSELYKLVKKLHQAIFSKPQEYDPSTAWKNKPWVQHAEFMKPEEKIDTREKAERCFSNFLSDFMRKLYDIERGIISLITVQRSNYFLTNKFIDWVLMLAIDRNQGEIKAIIEELTSPQTSDRHGLGSEGKLLLEVVCFLIELIDNNRAILDNIDWKESMLSAFTIIEKRRQRMVARMDQEKDIMKTALDGYISVFAEPVDEVPDQYGFFHMMLLGRRDQKEDDDPEGLRLMDDYHNAREGFEGYINILNYYSEWLHGMHITMNDIDLFSFDLLRSILMEIKDPLEIHYNMTTTEIIKERMVAKQRDQMERGNKVFSKKLASSLYELVNGTVFAPVSLDNFMDSLNNPFPPAHLTVEKDQTIKAIYLVKQLSYAIPQSNRLDWVDNMLTCLGIKLGTYRSKNYQCGSSGASEDNKAFARRLNDLLISNGIELG